MTISLRPYQEECLESIMGAIPHDRHILVQAATGSGKTIIFCELIRRLLSDWPHIKIGILAHRRELITQAHLKLLKVWPEAPIGIACASLGGPVDTDRPVVIGSIQTLIGRAETTSPFDLIIIDEAHRLGPINQASQYAEWLGTMKRYNPEVRILGVTATPFRLGHGYIYGSVCKPDNQNLFEALHYRVGIKDLQAHGFLCGYRAKEAERIERDLASVKVSGDYNIKDLSDVMSREQHVGSAVKALRDYGQDRKRAVVFCVTIDHAKRVSGAFGDAGFSSAAVHSDMPMPQRDMILRNFESGKIRVLCNVGVLTEGWDSPAVDCILLCRPTKAPSLYVQMVGRGLRPHPDKADVLILDLSDNCRTHGDPDSPCVGIPGKPIKQVAPTKSCPQCMEIVPAGAAACRGCGYVWPQQVIELNGSAQMRDVKWSAVEKPKPITVEIERGETSRYVSKAGNDMLKLKLTCQHDGSLGTIHLNHFFMFDQAAHEYALRKSRSTWKMLTGSDPPASTAEADERGFELMEALPSHIEIIENGKYWNVHSWKAEGVDKRQAAIPFDNDEIPF